MVGWIIVAVGIPVCPIANRVLGQKTSRPAVVVAMPHQHKACVRIRLTAIAAAELERRCSPPGVCRQRAEARCVFVEGLVLARAVYRPQVAQLVVVIVKAGPVPMLTQTRRVDREAVRQYRRAGACAVAQISVRSLAVGHAYPQAQPIVNIGVDQAAGGLRQARRRSSSS